MKTMAATGAEKRLASILDQAQREPVVVRRRGKEVAVVMSMSEYERLRAGEVRAFLDLRNEVAAEALANGLTEERMAELLTGNET